MWNKGDIVPGRTYRLQLCHADGRRFFSLLEDESAPSTQCVFTTEIVPTRLLESRNIVRIADDVRLRDGRRFVVDAHGIWFTEGEVAAMRRGDDHEAIDWVTGVAPKRAPK
jgi:hypothetical protein